MSYSRFSEDCDVYTYCGGKAFHLMVPGDKLYNGEQDFKFDTVEEMLEFTKKLESEGYKVPRSTYYYMDRDTLWEQLENMDKYAEQYGFELAPEDEWDEYADEEFPEMLIHRIYRTKDKKYRYLEFVMVYEFEDKIKEGIFDPGVTYVDIMGSGNDSLYYWADGSSWEENYGEESEEDW